MANIRVSQVGLESLTAGGKIRVSQVGLESLTAGGKIRVSQVGLESLTAGGKIRVSQVGVEVLASSALASFAVNTPVTQNAGTAFTLLGTYSGPTPTGINAQIDAGAFTALTGVTIGGGTWSGSLTISTVGSHTVTAQEVGGSGLTATTAAFSVGQITINAVPLQLTSTPITVSGTYSGVTPSGLTYSLDGGLLVAFPSPTISGGTWSATTVAGVSTTGTHTIAVAESPATHVFSSTVNFTAALGTITINTPSGYIYPGEMIPVTGTYTGVVPTGINYCYDGSGSYASALFISASGGNWTAYLPAPAFGFHTLTVQDANSVTVTGSCYIYVSALPGTLISPPTTPPVVFGSQLDFQSRLRALLPKQWFPSTPYGIATNSPVLDGVLAGLASAWSGIITNLNWAFQQARVRTATDVWLDVAAKDYFGVTLQRRAGESDTQFRARILASLLRPAGTRAALIAALNTLTGATTATVFEPNNPSDTGGYNVGGVGRNVAGGYGDLGMPFQYLVTTPRALGGGIAYVGGRYTGSGPGYGGYNVGALEYASTAMIQGAITDAEIYATVTAVIPAGTTAWVQLH